MACWKDPIVALNSCHRLPQLLRCALLLAAPVLPLHATTRSALQASSVQIQFCPSPRIWTHSLDDLHGVHSVLLQSAAVVAGSRSIKILQIDIQLMNAGMPIDQRRLDSAHIQSLAAAAPRIQKAITTFPVQFCSGHLLRPGINLGGPTLRQGEAFIFLQEPFVYTGRRDALHVILHVRLRGRNVTRDATVPIANGYPSAAVRFPLQGTWYIQNSPSFHSAHRWIVTEEFAYDMIKIGADGMSHGGDGTRFTDFRAYGAPVTAMAGGTVVASSNNEPEDARTLQQPGESEAAYAARLADDQARRLRGGVASLLGNYIIIAQEPNLFGLYAHLQSGSVVVHKGDKVSPGDVLGRVGSSGNSTEPHLHFQLCDDPDPVACHSVPVRFNNVSLPLMDGPRTLQTGDVIVAK